MPKRKAVDAPASEQVPTKRVTRSAGALSTTQPVANARSPTKRRGRPPGIPANAIPKFQVYGKKGARARSPTTSSLKENVRFEDDGDEDQGEVADELNISSESEKPSGPVRSSRKVALDSVVTTAPRRIRTATQQVAASKSSRTVAQTSKTRQDPPQLSGELNSVSELCEVVPPSARALEKRPQITLPKPLPSSLAGHLSSQKEACLAALRDPPLAPDDEDEVNNLALKQITDLIRGTVERGEGNSCLVLGPAGSGKTRVS